MLRPKNFYWSDSISVIENSRKISLSEWETFKARINEFRVYKGLEHFTFTSALKGTSMKATQYNEAVEAISEINSNIDSVVQNQSITPEHFYALSNALNAIDPITLLGDECFITARLSVSFNMDDTPPPTYELIKGYNTERLQASLSVFFVFDNDNPPQIIPINRAYSNTEYIQASISADLTFINN